MMSLRCWAGLLVVATAMTVPLIAERALGKQHASNPALKSLAPKAPDEKLRTSDLEMLLRFPPPKPENGLTLRINSMLKPARNPDTIAIEWEFKYTGPRQPLTIMKPSLTVSNQPRDTEVLIYSKGKSGEYYRTDFYNPGWPAEDPYYPKKTCFVTVPKNEIATGKIDIAIEDIKKKLLIGTQNEFTDMVAPEMFAWMHYYARFRGEKHILDAWTGRLESDLIPIRLDKW